jgi:hypothetical protein
MSYARRLDSLLNNIIIVFSKKTDTFICNYKFRESFKTHRTLLKIWGYLAIRNYRHHMLSIDYAARSFSFGSYINVIVSGASVL